ncbi:putative centromere protein S [Paratrimastix pyriformis]|uniref:Centromere protein S n=1 Tax=Paratrimastix pyriformis TaxID=342808 RepID=A0ABQ8UHM0_9EUKA|nr:putative centromere protein S [Paratrimastix pyriformis]
MEGLDDHNIGGEEDIKEEHIVKCALYYALHDVLQDMMKTGEEQEQDMTISHAFEAGLTEVLFRFSQSYAEDLRAFAHHAKRTTINLDDVKLTARKSKAMVEHLQTFAEKNCPSANPAKARKPKKKGKPDEPHGESSKAPSGPINKDESPKRKAASSSPPRPPTSTSQTLDGDNLWLAKSLTKDIADKEIGYTKTFPPASLDWLFVPEATRPFLNWLINSIGPDNVLTEQEVQTFETVVVPGNKELRGEQLATALKTISPSPTESLPATPDEDLDSPAELEHLRRRLRQLTGRRDHFVALKRKQEAERVRLATHQQEAEMRLREAHSAAARIGDLLDQRCAALQECSADLFAFYERAIPSPDASAPPPPPPPPPESSSSFLATAPLEPYEEADNAHMHAIRTFVEQLPQDRPSARPAAAPGGAKTTVSATDRTDVIIQRILYAQDAQGSPGPAPPTAAQSNALMLGEMQLSQDETYRRQSQELARLQDLYPVTQRQLLEARMSAALWGAVHQQAAERAARLSPADIRLIADLCRFDAAPPHLPRGAALTERSRAIRRLMETIPAMLGELARVQGAEILQANYKQKHRNQLRWKRLHNRVVDMLLSQQARHLLLGACIRAETEAHRDVADQVRTMEREIAVVLGRLDAHMANALPYQVGEDSTGPRQTVPSDDLTAHRLYALLTGSPPPQAQPAPTRGTADAPTGRSAAAASSSFLLSHAALMDMCRRVVLQAHAQDEFRLARRAADELLRRVSLNTALAERLLFGAAGSPFSRRPLFAPVAVLHAIRRLNGAADRLTSELEQLLREAKSLMPGEGAPIDRLAAFDRDLYLHFFLSPPTLQRFMDEFTQRARAMEIAI